MPTLSQRSFTGGEIAPALQARVDTSKYATGAKTIRNMLVMRHGGVTNRPGFKKICETIDSSKMSVLVPFHTLDGGKYHLEFGNLYIRVFKNRQPVYISVAASITGISNGTATTVTAVAHGIFPGSIIQIDGVEGMPEVNGRRFEVSFTNYTANTFEIEEAGIPLNSSAYGTYISGGSMREPFQILAFWPTADLLDLKFSPEGNVLSIAHKNYAPYELTYVSETNWTLDFAAFAPRMAAPAMPGTIGVAAGSEILSYVVTAISATTGEESYASPAKTDNAAAMPTVGSPVRVNWLLVPGAVEYNVYRMLNGIYGFIGVAGPSSGTAAEFKDIGVTPTITETPPIVANPFSGSGNDPANVSFFQQRRVYMATDNEPDGLWLSRIGHYANFTKTSPTKEDDAIHIRLAGQGRNEIRHAVNLGSLIVLTEDGEWVIGAQGAAITPFEINARQHSYNGASKVSPILLGANMLYIQANGSVVRDFGFDYQVDGYRGNDLTIFSAHLFDGHTFTSWAYQQTPHSVVWMVRDDGALISLTYIREQEILAWHRHDTDGVVEHVSVLNENGKDNVYAVIKRTVGEEEKRYIEVMADRVESDPVDQIFMDACSTYDGRNDSNLGMAMSGSGWTYNDTLTLSSSSSYFKSSHVGTSIHITGPSGDVIRFKILGYTNVNTVTGKANRDIPLNMQSTTFETWAHAVHTVHGLWHLEGKAVSVLADGFVIASPNNDDYDIIIVENGSIILEDDFAVIHVGLPYISDLETLDIDTVQTETLVDKQKLIHKVSIHLEKTRGLWVGAKPPLDDETDPLQDLSELELRSTEGYDEPIVATTGIVPQRVLPEWNSNGRVFIRQVDPLPVSILGVSPEGSIPFKGGR